MTRIQRIEPISAMRVGACFHAGVGLVFGIVLTIFSRRMGFVAADSGTTGWQELLLGPMAILFLPVIYGAIGALTVGFGAVTYNFATRFVGGLEVELIIDPVPVSIPPASSAEAASRP